MNKTLMLLLTAGLLASCAPKSNTATTTDTTTGTVATDTTTPVGTADTTATTTDTAGTAAGGVTDTTATPADTTGTAAGTVAGDALVGTVASFDGSAQTMTLDDNGKTYNVVVDASTVYEGVGNTASTAADFWGTDHANANVAVQGTVNGDTLTASKINLQ